MKHHMNLINVVTEITIHLYLLHRLPKHLQIIILDICIHQITLNLTEVHLRAYHHHLLIHIRAMVLGMVVLTIRLRIIIICNHQIILTLTEVHLPAFHLLMHIRVMVPGMVVLLTLSLRIIIIIGDIMVLETIVGSLVEATITIITIKADHHLRCLLIFLRVLLHLWEPVITIVIDITEAKGGTITEDQTLLVVVATGGGEITNKFPILPVN